MAIRKTSYLLSASVAMLAAVAAACTDDYFNRDDGPHTNSNMVAFAATVGKGAEDISRAEKPIYDPLIVKSDGAGEKLYLHTYEVNQIGYKPGLESAKTVDSRGVQVESAEGLEQFHKNFEVRAQYADNAEEFIPWSKAKVSSADKTVWNTDKVYFWPASEILSFHAVSPSSEFDNVKNKTWNNDNISFSYTAKKSPDGNSDAEIQEDLLFAATNCNKEQSTAGRAPLQFNHALSAIKFAIRDIANGEVVNIKITGVASSGDCVYTYSAPEGEDKFVWSNLKGEETYSQNFNYKFTQGHSPIAPDDESHDILINATMPEKTFMLIPQEIPDDAMIEVTLKRNRSTDSNAAPETVILRGRIKDNKITRWRPGHEYVYTISSTSDNWVYVLEACGNHEHVSADNYGHIGGEDVEHYNDITDHNMWHPTSDLIFVYAPMNQAFDKYEERAHYHVRSYRYHANNPELKQILPWKANYGEDPIKQYQNDGTEFPGTELVGRDLENEKWIPDKTKLEGKGSFANEGEVVKFEFYPHNAISSWLGDQQMQILPAYKGNSKSNPWDLSRMEAASGADPLNTANSYVIDRQGWYIFPCVYGNAIKDGKTNTAAYTIGKTSTLRGYKFLNNFVDHRGNNITNPWINRNYCGSATLVWADIYAALTDIELIDHNGKKYIRFYANQYNLVQGNVVIALIDKDSSEAVWSWHIWVNEHWLDSDPTEADPKGKSHAYNKNYTGFTQFQASPSGRRNRGDLQVSIPNRTNYKYFMAPVNLGWCDPKSNYYLRRYGKMTYVQYLPDGSKPTGLTTQLNILQNGLKVDYKFGNNTYYQFGRKDPFIGFRDHENRTKRNFGPDKYKGEYDPIEDYSYKKYGKPVDISYAIKHPNTLIVETTSGTLGTQVTNNDWCNIDYFNLWNNTSSDPQYINNGNTVTVDAPLQKTGSDYGSNCVKTIYDPCPPGYMVPPADVWRIVGRDVNGRYGYTDGRADLGKNFNGEYLGWSVANTDELYYSYNIWADKPAGAANGNDNKITLASTGQRWFSDRHTVGGTMKAGYNMNSFCVYLWTSTPLLSSRSSFCLALGRDTSPGKEKVQWNVCAYFFARKAMARPVRPVREEYSK